MITMSLSFRVLLKKKGGRDSIYRGSKEKKGTGWGEVLFMPFFKKNKYCNTLRGSNHSKRQCLAPGDFFFFF